MISAIEKGTRKVNLKKVKYLIYALGAACALMVVLFCIIKSLVFLWLALIFAAAGVAVNLAWWRCPYCGGHLGRDVSQYCTHCGKKLDDLG